MKSKYSKSQQSCEFAEARREFSTLEGWLASNEAHELTHGALEASLEMRGRELLRKLLQSHLELRARGERRQVVVGNDGATRTHVRQTERGLMTVFGRVRVRRLGYAGRGIESLFPADGRLNLPSEAYSHGLRLRVAVEAAKGSYDETVTSICTYTGGHVPKRQAEQLSARAARDFDDFYRRAKGATAQERSDDLLVMTVDGKGIVMRAQDLREETRRAAKKAKLKLTKRLSRGETRCRKRMATVAAVYSVAAQSREPEDVMRDLAAKREDLKPRPRAYNKRVWASLQKSQAEVIDELFQEALRRDPQQRRTWVVLQDGAIQQKKLMLAAAKRYGVQITLVMDFIHVLERLWQAAWRFFEEGDAQAEPWVRKRAIRVLQGHSSNVAAGIRRAATLRGFEGHQRRAIDRIANYIILNRAHIRYAAALREGWPIATGVIEGACRHLIMDRMDITGARWSLEGAEAILRLRALRSSGDFNAYWSFHLQQEKRRHHSSRYAVPIPMAA